jgi:hypothetical protein
MANKNRFIIRRDGRPYANFPTLELPLSQGQQRRNTFYNISSNWVEKRAQGDFLKTNFNRFIVKKRAVPVSTI